MKEGNIEVSLLKEILSEVRAGRASDFHGFSQSFQNITVPEIRNRDDLYKFLVGSTWRKKSGLEEIIFKDEQSFFNNLAGHPSWVENNYSLGKRINEIVLKWSVDKFLSPCVFQNGYTEIVELLDPEQCVWQIIAQEPFRPDYGA